jgi:CHAD domain-containing protein
MAAKRTSISRRLRVGRRAYRPPVGAGKSGHLFILAPLAASVAIGCAVALARVSSSRRTTRSRAKADDARLGLIYGEQLGGALQRMALGQIDLARESLSGELPLDTRSVHELRKAIKRLRALMHLLEGELEHASVEDRVLRDLGRRLSGARDAAVLLSTLESMLADNRKLASGKRVRGLRRRLALEQARAERETLADPRLRVEMLADLMQLRERVERWQLLPDGHAGPIERRLRVIYRRGRRQHQLLQRGKRSGMQARHEWRKRAKDLRYAAEMLQPSGPAPADARSSRDADLRKTARRADKLSELLGEEHDLGLLARWLDGDGARDATGGRALGARKKRQLQAAIAKRRRKLRKRAMTDGRRLYRRRPKRFAARVRLRA